MHLRLIPVLCVLALSSTISTTNAQGRHITRRTRPAIQRGVINNPQYFDLHFFMLRPPEPGELPQIDSLGSRRYGPFQANQRATAVKASQSIGQPVPGLRRLKVAPESNELVSFEYSFRTRRMRTSGSQHFATGDVATLGYGLRNPTIRIAIRSIPQGEDPEPLALWSAEDLAAHMGERVLSEPAKQLGGLLGTFIRLPMQRLLPLPMVAKLRDHIASPEWRAPKLSVNYSSHQLSREDVRRAALMILGDPEATMRSLSYQWDQGILRQVVMTSYAQSDSPDYRGHLGWFLTRPNSFDSKQPMMAAFVEPFYRDIEAGAATLSGAPAEVLQRTTYLRRLAEEKQVLLPLLVLFGAALALFSVCMLARRMAHLGA